MKRRVKKKDKKLKVVKVKNNFSFSIGNPFFVLMIGVGVLIAITMIVKMNFSDSNIQLSPLKDSYGRYYCPAYSTMGTAGCYDYIESKGRYRIYFDRTSALTDEYQKKYLNVKVFYEDGSEELTRCMLNSYGYCMTPHDTEAFEIEDSLRNKDCVSDEGNKIILGYFDKSLQSCKPYDCISKYVNGKAFAYANNGESMFYIPGPWNDNRILCYNGVFYEEYTPNLIQSRDDWPYVSNKKICESLGDYYFDDVNGVWKKGNKLNLRLIPSTMKSISGNDASGITFNSENNFLYYIDNGDDNIYRLNSNYNVEKTFSTSVLRLEDPEGITFISGNKYAVIDEQKMKLYVFSLDDNSGSIELKGDPVSVGTRGDGGGLEGLAYHKDLNSYFISLEYDPMNIYKVDANTLEVTNPFDTEDLLGDYIYDISDIAINPINGNLILLSKFGEERTQGNEPMDAKIVEMTISGQVVNVFDLPIPVHELPEGITFDNFGNLYIVGEKFDGSNSAVSSEFQKYKVDWC